MSCRVAACTIARADNFTFCRKLSSAEHVKLQLGGEGDVWLIKSLRVCWGWKLLDEVKPEIKLYPHVLRWLHMDFRTSDALIGGDIQSTLFSADVSQKKSDIGGHWSRPDLATIAYRRGVFTPSWEASIYSFEVKCYSTINQAAVYEAVAHTRFVHYSYLLWQDEEMPNKQSWRIVDLCREFGIGVITTSAPNDVNTYRLRVRPKRNQITILESDKFIQERFPVEEQTRIKEWLSANDWKQSGEGYDSL